MTTPRRPRRHPPRSARLCILDVNGGAALPCFVTPFGMDTASLAIGHVVNPTQDDVILVHTPPVAGQASVFIVRNFRAMGGNAIADSTSPPFDVNLTSPRAAVLQLDSGPEEVVLGQYTAGGGKEACCEECE